MSSDKMTELEQRVMGEDDLPDEEDKYGNIHHPKQHLLTGVLYALSLAAVLFGAILFKKLIG